jgi:hypothetical protein
MKRVLSCLAFFLMVGSGFAQSNLPMCQGADASKWSNCFGTFTFASGNKYSGQWKDSRRSGQGTEFFVNGNKYVGEFKNDKPNGQGTLYATNGAVINQGIWTDGNFVGSSQIQQAVATKTEIEKQSNLPVCQGSNIFKWRNCFGTYTFGSGDTYAGEWTDGKLNGQGAATWANGDKYVGEFKDHKLNGQGTQSFGNGDIYAGQFKEDEFNGFGAYIPYNDSIYVGYFYRGQRSGEGVLYLRNRKIEKQGFWSANYLLNENELNVAMYPFPNIAFNQSVITNSINFQALQSNISQPAIAINIGKRIALVVGNANYKVRPLKNPRNDADDISRSLRSSGFEVIDLRDASLQQMRNGVRQFGDRLINNDVGLVYYSGHGVEVKGRNYFIPVNADIMREDEIADQGLDVSLILEKMNTAGKGVNILIVDACRDDPFGRSFRSSSRGLAQMDAPRGTIIAYATSPGKVASDGDPRERNSPYTKNLVKAMQQPNKPIEQVFKEVRRAVQEETKNQQTPWENTSLSGDFYFKVQR